ncbi:Hsp20/alpha crystallin family protein [Leptolyngbya sp. AN03gr2]|uniref:Hsp20/alpha crystallin family protein n=1 Tax=unclassified Leptolyngbya TaxID=2650499 RepID=UPI003D31AAA9
MLTSPRLTPWQEMELARRQFNQLFNELMPTREALWTPAIEFHTTEDGFTVRVQLPGIKAEDVDVQVGRDAIAITGERQFDQTDAKGFRSEFRYGKFSRVISLPAAIQNDQVKAEFLDGILTLTLPRLQAVKPAIVKLNLTGTDMPAVAAQEAPQTEAAPEADTADLWNS